MAKVPVPDAAAPLGTILEFASMTYFGYDRHGGVEPLEVLANRAAECWANGRQLPSGLNEARAALFFEARRWHHFGQEPDPLSERYLRALVRHISTLSHGAVLADREGPAMWLRRVINRIRSLLAQEPRPARS